mgnify:CR=1 FL=1
MSYSGISAQTMFLLAQNRFENSKIFYEEHKEQLKAGITVPMRQIAGELSPFMYEIDEMMKLDPVRMVSRIRRDTRYTQIHRNAQAELFCKVALSSVYVV